MAYKAQDLAFSTLALSIPDGATTLITVKSGEGSRFPAITSPDYTYLCLQDSANPHNMEIVKVTAHTSGSDSFTITRGEPGSTVPAQAWPAGTVVELRLTVGAFDTKADKLVPTTAGNVAELDSTGNLQDSGIALNTKADKLVPTAANNIAELDSTGNLADSGLQTSQFVRNDVAGQQIVGEDILTAKILPDSTDFNTVITPGFYGVGLLGANAPAGATNYGNLLVIIGQRSQVEQIYYDYSGNRSWRRGASNVYTTPTWSSWAEEVRTSTTAPVSGNLASWGGNGIIADAGFQTSQFIRNDTTGQIFTGFTSNANINVFSFQPTDYGLGKSALRFGNDSSGNNWYIFTNDGSGVGKSGNLYLYADNIRFTGNTSITINGNTAATKAGTTPAGNLASWDASGNLIDAGGTLAQKADVTYVDTQDAAKANKAGDTYTGTHDFTGATVSVATPASANDAATKAYVESVVGGGGGPSPAYFCAGGNNSSAAATSITHFSALNGDSSGNFTESIMGSICPLTGTLKNLRVRAGLNTETTGSTVFTILVNGVATALTVSIPASSTSVVSDTTHTVAVTAGDRITLKVDGTAISGAVAGINWSLEIA